MKPWWQSKTIWAALIGVVATVLAQVFKYTLDEGAQAHLVDAIMVIIDIISGAFIVVGRSNAQGPLGR